MSVWQEAALAKHTNTRTRDRKLRGFAEVPAVEGFITFSARGFPTYRKGG